MKLAMDAKKINNKISIDKNSTKEIDYVARNARNYVKYVRVAKQEEIYNGVKSVEKSQPHWKYQQTYEKYKAPAPTPKTEKQAFLLVDENGTVIISTGNVTKIYEGYDVIDGTKKAYYEIKNKYYTATVHKITREEYASNYTINDTTKITGEELAEIAIASGGTPIYVLETAEIEE